MTQTATPAAPAITADTPPAELLARFTPHLKIAHQVPGRVRLKLGMKALEGIKLNELESNSAAFAAVLKQITGIRNISWNLLAHSCTVEYDPRAIPDAAWPDLLAGKPSAAAQSLHAILENTHANLRAALRD